ncbi:ATP-binding protein [Streptomyces sp. G7(2002)]|uniref:ATP-binding protein n=1 Tax=Streptomyces sp. G7(2002) TaxID=2971798 RepID=UPI00237DE9E6|nr:ATP-binding protein [Streptomyces sp. G7(2002)]WDT52588.1 ATP-binding protein [Streptomyces sp. G7(2002)]
MNPNHHSTPTALTNTPHGTARYTRHYLNLPRARTVITSQVRAAAQALEATIEEQTMMCLTGQPGTGKTFTLHTILDQHPHWHALRLLVRPQARPSDIRAGLYRALNLPGTPPTDPGICDDLIRHALHHPVRLLAVDEAHQLSTACLEYLRFLHDDPHTRLAVLFLASQHRIKALRAQPALASRVTTWHDIHPLDNTEIATVLPAFHLQWRDSTPSLICELNNAWAHGNFRRWAALTHRRASITHRTGHSPHDPSPLLKGLHPRPKKNL